MPYEFADQEAPQAHAQEEAQKNASSHTPPASQIDISIKKSVTSLSLRGGLLRRPPEHQGSDLTLGVHGRP
jgi:hypothetical protein